MTLLEACQAYVADPESEEAKGAVLNAAMQTPVNDPAWDHWENEIVCTEVGDIYPQGTMSHSIRTMIEGCGVGGQSGRDG